MPSPVARAWVLNRRLATQRLTGAPCRSSAEVIDVLTAAQCQDLPLAWWSLRMRMRQGTHQQLRAGHGPQSSGDGHGPQGSGDGLTRTHVLRPTWHLVRVSDLRWLQALTGPKVFSSTAARRRALGLEGPNLSRRVDYLASQLSAGPLTRREIQGRFAASGDPASNQQLAHLLMAAEVQAQICGGPPRHTEHTYVLVDHATTANADDQLSRDEAVRRLTHRFMAGHGPAGERDLTRWSALTLGEVRGALGSLVSDGSLCTVDCEGTTLWFDPAVPARTTRHPSALLIPTFDEVALSYRHLAFPRTQERLDRTRLVAQSGGGIAVVDGVDVGLWTRRTGRRGLQLRIVGESRLAPTTRSALAEAATAMAAFGESDLTVHFD